MRAGELDRSIVIDDLTDAKDDYGGKTETWAPFATVWAKVTPLRGGEYQAAAQIGAQVDTVFRIRWLAGVTRRMRINYDGQVYDIQHIAELGRREGLAIMARIHQAT